MRGLLTTIKTSPNYKWWAASAISAGTLLTVADIGELNVALPVIADDFDSDLRAVQWLATGNMVATSAFALPMGRLSDMIGRKKVYLWGLSTFVLGAALGAVASNLGVLILTRIIQGVAMGMVVGNQMAMTTAVFPTEERGKALGIHTTMVALGLVLGPALGGVLVDAVGWRSVFFFNLAVAAVYFIPAVVVLDERRVTPASAAGAVGFDRFGALLSAAAMVAFLMGMTNPFDWGPGYVLGILAGAAALLTSFLAWERRAPSPMIDLSLFKSTAFSVLVASRGLVFIAMASVVFTMPFYLQGVAGYSPVRTGLILTTMALAMAVLGPLPGRFSDRFGSRRFTVLGAAFVSASLYVLTGVGEVTPLWAIMLGVTALGLGMGIFNAPNASAILREVPRRQYGAAAAFLQALRTTSFVVGIAVTTVIVTLAMSDAGFEPQLSVISHGAGHGPAVAFVFGLRLNFLAMAALPLAAVVLSSIRFRGVQKPALEAEAGRT